MRTRRQSIPNYIVVHSSKTTKYPSSKKNRTPQWNPRQKPPYGDNKYNNQPPLRTHGRDAVHNSPLNIYMFAPPKRSNATSAKNRALQQSVPFRKTPLAKPINTTPEKHPTNRKSTKHCRDNKYSLNNLPVTIHPHGVLPRNDWPREHILYPRKLRQPEHRQLRQTQTIQDAHPTKFSPNLSTKFGYNNI